MEATLIVLAVAAGAALQSATGFGFALVAAPLAFALLEPGEAVWLLTLLALGVNVLTLAGERRRPRPLGSDTAWLLAWSAPGALAGVAVLRALGDLLLQALVSAAVLGGLLARRIRPARTRPWQRPLAGLTAGVLSTSTGTNGPPLVLYLLGRGAAPERVRDTLAALFTGACVLSIAVLAGAGVEPLPDPALVAVSGAAGAAGHLLGRRVFRRLAGRGYEAALVAVLVATLAGGLLRALG